MTPFLIKCTTVEDLTSAVRERSTRGDVDKGFEDDIYALVSYSLIIIACMEGGNIRNASACLASHKEMAGELERWKHDDITRLSSVSRATGMRSERFVRLFPQAKAAKAYRPGDRNHLILGTTILSKSGSYARARGTMRWPKGWTVRR